MIEMRWWDLCLLRVGGEHSNPLRVFMGSMGFPQVILSFSISISILQFIRSVPTFHGVASRRVSFIVADTFSSLSILFS